MTVFEWLWRTLPDRREMPDCLRRGVRGNENRFGGKIVCDYCHSILIMRRERVLAERYKGAPAERPR